MLADSTIEEIRKNISDQHTQAVSAYNPQGYESLETWVNLDGTIVLSDN